MVFGRGIPHALAFWLLRSLPHRLIQKSDPEYSPQKHGFQITENSITALVIFTKEGRVKKALFREKEKIVIFEVEDYMLYDALNSGATGYFYKTIHIYNNFSKDYFKVRIDKIKLTH